MGLFMTTVSTIGRRRSLMGLNRLLRGVEETRTALCRIMLPCAMHTPPLLLLFARNLAGGGGRQIARVVDHL